MIRTGLQKLDEALGGGIRSGVITDISGASSTGKTQLALQVMVNLLSGGGSIFYQDTTGTFRPERLLELLKTKSLDPANLDRVTVSRVTSTRDQMNGILTIQKSDFALVVIDNVTDLFSFEYSREEQLLEKTTQFAKYMKDLSHVAVSKKIPVLVVNMVRNAAEIEQENMESVISVFTHVKIKLAKRQSVYEGRVFVNTKTNQFFYKITREGLVETT
ncbi:ATPase domain-containing protein [Candidatus Nitrosotenuis cloacae]|uniref:ATPase domain-containing protein n=1 Tax=Candidatus Nitrosotenuis cloacae TaxID=1603555 RepID=UPI0022823222|nr:ATPase domain-containing protein [Candidatus Nitrosotenuis cloacae]